MDYWNYNTNTKKCCRECKWISNGTGQWDAGFDDWEDPCMGRPDITPIVVEVSADDDHLDDNDHLEDDDHLEDEHREQTLDDLDDSPDSPITACDDNEPCSSLMHSLSIGIILIISFIL